MIIYKLFELEGRQFNIWVCWVPGLCGIKGNEAVSAAKEALSADLKKLHSTSYGSKTNNSFLY